ncbi:MAG: hypothetical protein KC800_08900 [Candidatus Eremiobacteraeota bacterium]|nr:hypothetical protein [Candidatus Eremiobacteraeota bacterium]
MVRAADTYRYLGSHAGFEDWLKRSQYAMMIYLGVFPFLAGFALASDEYWFQKLVLYALFASLGSLALLYIAKTFVKVELVLDRERQQLLYRRRIFGFQQLVPKASVEELWKVVTAAEIPAAPLNYWWRYVTLLITRSGGRFRVGRHESKYRFADQESRKLAQELDIEYLSGKEDEVLRVLADGSGEPVLRFKRFPLKFLDGLTVWFWALTLLTSPWLALALLMQ